MQSLEEAQQLFDRSGSPMALAARLHIASAASEDRSAMILDDLASSAPPRYRALHAQVQWHLALRAARDGSPERALQSIRAATATFAELGEEQSVGATRGITATILAASGDTQSAWRMRHAVMTSAAEAGDDFRLVHTVYAAAREAMAEGRWDIAHALLNVVAGTSHPHQRLREEALVWRALAAKRAQMPRTAAADLAKARATELMSEDLRLVEALVAEDEKETVALLTQSLRATDDPTATARFLLARARALGASQPQQAEEDLQRTLDLVESGDVIMAPDGIRDALAGSPLDAYRMLADALDLRGNPLRALEILERRRAWPRHVPRQALHNHLHALPTDVVIVNYGLYDERIVIYANDDIRATVSVTSAEVTRLVAAFAESVKQNDVRRFRDISRQLSRILFDPIAGIIQPSDVLVFVRDPALGCLPFGALVKSNGRYLIEDHAVVVAPSTTTWLELRRRKPGASRALLAIGNALPGTHTGSLAGAEGEAKAIVTMYPSRALLVGAAATKQRVISNLAYCDTAHFAVHANADLGDAMPPHLILSRTKEDDGKLMAAEIAALKLDNLRTVVLAGCRTAAGTRSLVDAFLAAGAGSVVGTLWEIEDAGTREMSVLLHRELRNGATPAAA
ncbi:MAG TPA: CHAT domain-containing protein, partial [Thermoanaerobaculia bacterium]|nr:CHAT domain-containing protein [Thermoanaerobaculia bacterium]